MSGKFKRRITHCGAVFVLAGAVLLTVLPSFSAPPKTEEERYAALRKDMVESQIADDFLMRKPVRDKAVLDAMRTVPRHKFLPADVVSQAYSDHAVAIGYGQTISQPYIVAYMTEMLRPKKTDVVLEIGTGSGYQAAVLSGLVKEVYTIEIIKELGESAKTRLAELGYTNVHAKIGDGYFGWPEHGQFDSIIVTAAASHIPPPLIEQLKPGGRMAIPVGPPLQVQSLMFVEKRADGSVGQRSVMAVGFVPLTGGGTAKAGKDPEPVPAPSE